MKYILWFLVLVSLTCGYFFISCHNNLTSSPVAPGVTVSDSATNNAGGSVSGPAEADVVPPPEQVDEIKWMAFNKKTLQYIKTNNLCVMMYFSRENCAGCQAMMETTFKDQQTVKMINSKFVSVKYPEDLLDDTKFEINELPTVLMVPDNKEVKSVKISGYINASDLQGIILRDNFNGCDRGK